MRMGLLGFAEEGYLASLLMNRNRFLRYAGAVTNDPRKAAGGPATQFQQDEWETKPAMAAGEAIPPRPGKRKQSDMPTVPTPLQGDS